MKWEKKGLIFSPNNNFEWMHSHAAVPLAEKLGGDLFRIFFTTRDKKNRSHGAYIDIDITNPSNIIQTSQKPVLEPGPLGSFDDSGAMPSCIVSHDGDSFLFYTGWSLGVTVPFYFYIGLARYNKEKKTFEKVSNAPILERTDKDPFLSASPYVIIDDEMWKMWYVSCIKWELDNAGNPRHHYSIRYAESKDGVSWKRRNQFCIPFKTNYEYAIARPYVIMENNFYKMWYSYRGGENTYRIGYAESDDGITWERMDEKSGIDVSLNGWDSDMIEYPFIFTHKEVTYMLYNGNEYGKSGFGYAVLSHN